MAAARAAPTVPEMSTSLPMFWPELMPDTTRSGRSATPPSSAQFTESAGKPATAVAW